MYSLEYIDEHYYYVNSIYTPARAYYCVK